MNLSLFQHRNKAILLRLDRRFAGNKRERFRRHAAGETKLTAEALTRPKGIFVKLARLARTISAYLYLNNPLQSQVCIVYLCACAEGTR
jgi:hypothetical protein